MFEPARTTGLISLSVAGNAQQGGGQTSQPCSFKQQQAQVNGLIGASFKQQP
jgi:hypothetical protein